MSKGAGQQTTTNSLDPQTAAMQKQIFDQAQRTYDNYKPSVYGGPTVAGASGLSNTGASQVGNASQAMNGIMNANFGLGNQYSAQAMYGGSPSGPSGPDMSAYQQAGNNGAAALGGDPNAIQHFMDPYQKNVIDQVKGQYGDLNGMAQMGINDEATKQGAFGGSRHGVAEGVASANIAKGLGQQIAGLQSQGYQNAMNQANMAAGQGLNAGNLGLGYGNLGLGYQNLGLNRQLGMGQLGLQANGQAQSAAMGAAGLGGQLFGMGDYYRGINQQQLDQNQNNFNTLRDWDVNRLGILTGARGGPYGSTQSTPLTRNVGAGALGGAATGAQIGSIIPGVGTAIGAGIGGLLGIL